HCATFVRSCVDNEHSISMNSGEYNRGRMQYQILAAALILTAGAFAQGRGPTTGSTTGAGSSAGTTTRPGTSTLPGTNGASSSPFPIDAPRPILISGKVVLDDGTTPPQGTLVERVCAGGRPRPEAYTDSKGHFTATLEI